MCRGIGGAGKQGLLKPTGECVLDKMAMSVSCVSCETKDWEQVGYHRNLPAWAEQYYFSHQPVELSRNALPSGSVNSVKHPEGYVFVSLDTKEGFICIVFQAASSCWWQLGLDLPHAMAMDYSGRGYEEAGRLMNRRRELGTRGKGSSYAEKIQKSGKWQCCKIPENNGDSCW